MAWEAADWGRTFLKDWPEEVEGKIDCDRKEVNSNPLPIWNLDLESKIITKINVNTIYNVFNHSGNRQCEHSPLASCRVKTRCPLQIQGFCSKQFWPIYTNQIPLVWVELGSARNDWETETSSLHLCLQNTVCIRKKEHISFLFVFCALR